MAQQEAMKEQKEKNITQKNLVHSRFFVLSRTFNSINVTIINNL
jgi:hypothetical protein